MLRLGGRALRSHRGASQYALRSVTVVVRGNQIDFITVPFLEGGEKAERLWSYYQKAFESVPRQQGMDEREEGMAWRSRLTA